MFGQTAKKGFYLTSKCFLLISFQEHKSVNSVREWSILAVRIAKFKPLREPIRMLLFTLDRFSLIIELFIERWSCENVPSVSWGVMSGHSLPPQALLGSSLLSSPQACGEESKDDPKSACGGRLVWSVNQLIERACWRVEPLSLYLYDRSLFLLESFLKGLRHGNLADFWPTSILEIRGSQLNPLRALSLTN